MRKSPRTLLAAGLIAGALSIGPRPSPLQAQQASAEELFRKGNLSYDLGRYDEAIAFFQRSYEVSGEPLLLYNLAQAHRRKGACPQARDGYQNFIRRAGKAENAGEYRIQVEQAEAQLQQLQQQCPALVVASKPAAPPVVIFAPPEPPRTKAEESGRDSRKILGWVALSVGAAALGGAGYAAYRVDGIEEHLSRAPVFDPVEEQRGLRFQGLKWGLLVSGGVLVAAGAALLVVGHRR